MSKAASVLPTPIPITRTRTLRRLRRWIVLVGMGVVVLAVIIAAVAWDLSRKAPRWWRTTDPENPHTIAIGEQVEQGVANVLYEVRDGDTPWSVTVHAADANAWLATRLDAWLANGHPDFDWPDEIRDLQVEFDDGLVIVGLKVVSQDRTQFLSMALEPHVRDDGSLWLIARRIHLGRLPIPAGLLLGSSTEQSSTIDSLVPAQILRKPEVQHLLSALKGDAPLTTNPILSLGDGRTVRLLGVDTRAGILRVECQTQ